MNINKILPILLPQPKNASQPSMQNAQHKSTKHAEQPAPAVLPDIEKAMESEKPQASRTSGTTEVSYLPLPLKCEVFKDALFFVRHYHGDKAKQQSGNTAFFIKLDTGNLGILWISLESVVNRGLVVRLVAESEDTRQKINEIIPHIKDDLEKLGYSNVAALCSVQPNVRHCQDIDHGATGLAVNNSLLDWQV